MQEKASIQRLQSMPLPQQNLSQLSFCENKGSAVRTWAEQLPITRISATAAALYKLLPELAQLDVKPEERLEMLEAIRPAMQQINLGLAKEFLNKPIILPERSHKAATISQALQKHMVNGYLIVARDLLLNHKKIKKDTQIRLATALHRAITGMGRMMLRSLQLYVPMNVHFWEQMHNLFHLAEDYELLSTNVHDPIDNQQPSTTIAQAYMRLLLLSCASPNRLRQSELEMLYVSLEHWSSDVRISTLSNKGQNLFVVDIQSDSGPLYKAQIRGNSDTSRYREIDSASLVQQLKAGMEKRQSGQKIEDFHLPPTLGDNLLRHLLSVWTVQPHRNFQRNTKDGAISVLVGMSCIHFHLADRTPLENFIGHNDATSMLHRNSSNQLNRFMDSGKNAWDHAMDSSSSGQGYGVDIEFDENESQKDYSEQYPINTAQLVDTSPTGYCLEWRQRIPTHVRTGEVLGLKEAGRGSWSLGVVRWLSQNQGATRCGIELLSPNATPYAAFPLASTDENQEYLRAFLLPAIPALKKTAMLLTANLPFQENSKVRLNLHGKEQTVLLQKRAYHTSSISLFEFRNLEESNESFDKPPQENDKDDFSDILDDL